ncbi:replicative DNA helicase [Salmonella enterica subsp. enterica serovar Uganda]|uniref:SPI-7-type island replicative DNA helicase n=1 Tax=Citrobacter koseri TaxID=545 RepID=UPI00107A8B1C|nr:SPI-7-type island replicative DNA helicase [Citrobacter koseri]EAB3870761.1 replicative DNA helicase [Salmonella enterica]EAC1542173.1 replicative DNA helicase [Salmonella enterica subsp. enterica]EBO2751128.1 replicative DNA helicase [Salmonella enterica subsp. enterica serovar Agona]EDE1789021.1 replicative DNA helicase [Salmonella enterica subsp. enterica serovar Enteritidis]EEJ6011176.1 replicative DNA helicase [Salmonella enterica subsp. enterica serovar Meleagridis]EGC3413865.1 repli
MSELKNALEGLASLSLYAEQCVLGGLMLDNDRWDEVAMIISAEDFYSRPHRVIYQEMARLVNAGCPLDLITVSESIESQGKLEQLGGFAYLAEISKNIPSAANIMAYCEIVARYSRARQLARIGADITAEVLKPGSDIAHIMEKAERDITRLAERAEPEQAITLFDGMEKLLTELERRCGSPDGITGTPCGFSELDAMTSGLQAGDLILVAARPSMGKTAFLISLILNALMKTVDSVAQFYSLEQPAEQILMRMLSALGGVDLQRMKSGLMDDEDWARVSSASQILMEDLPQRLIIDDSSGLTPAMLRIRARRNARKYGKPSLIGLDYLQLMRSPEQENRTQEIAEISRSLKALAKEMECPVVALSQLNRSLESRADKRPNNGDLRDSGALEQDADVIIFIYRDEVYHENSPDKGTAEAIISKQRQGPTGVVRLKFEGKFTRFSELSVEGRY